MDSLVFFGSLRSKKLLEIIIGNNTNHLEFFETSIKNYKLFKVKNENFPYLEFTKKSKDIVDFTYVKNLSIENFNRSLFYESVEYKLSKINIIINNCNIKNYFFELIKKNKTTVTWEYKKWKVKYEKFSCIAAKEWMLLFDEYKDSPEEAEVFWSEMLQKAKKKLKKTL